MNENGFTFSEMLLVLAVVMTLVGIGIPSYQALETKQEERRFFDVLLHDIYAAQSENYATGSTVGITFRPQYGSYDIVRSFYGKIESREIPPSITLAKSSNLTSIYYTRNGGIMSSGTIHFDTSSGRRSLVVHLGKGRVVLSE